MLDEPFRSWVAAAERRYLADLTRAELGRALRALSSCYVERRSRLATGGPLASRGKRAAFALFYGPLHYLAVHHIVSALGLDGANAPRTLVDLGCGTGAASAAWAVASAGRTMITAFDVNEWAVREAAWTYRTLGVRGTARRLHIRQVRWRPGSAVLAAYVVNELLPEDRAELLQRFVHTGKDRPRPALVVEPIARRTTPWWAGWERAFLEAGGRADEWRVRTERPQVVQELDRAAGLDHREVTARTLLIG